MAATTVETRRSKDDFAQVAARRKFGGYGPEKRTEILIPKPVKRNMIVERLKEIFRGNEIPLREDASAKHITSFIPSFPDH